MVKATEQRDEEVCCGRRSAGSGRCEAGRANRTRPRLARVERSTTTIGAERSRTTDKTSTADQHLQTANQRQRFVFLKLMVLIKTVNE